MKHQKKMKRTGKEQQDQLWFLSKPTLSEKEPKEINTTYLEYKVCSSSRAEPINMILATNYGITLVTMSNIHISTILVIIHHVHHGKNHIQHVLWNCSRIHKSKRWRKSKCKEVANPKRLKSKIRILRRQVRSVIQQTNYLNILSLIYKSTKESQPIWIQINVNNIKNCAKLWYVFWYCVVKISSLNF